MKKSGLEIVLSLCLTIPAIAGCTFDKANVKGLAPYVTNDFDKDYLPEKPPSNVEFIKYNF